MTSHANAPSSEDEGDERIIRFFALRVCVESVEYVGRGRARARRARVEASDALARALTNAFDVNARSRTVVEANVDEMKKTRPSATHEKFVNGEGRVEFARAPAALAAALAEAPTLVLTILFSRENERDGTWKTMEGKAEIPLDGLVRAREVRYEVEVTNASGAVVGRARLTAALDELDEGRQRMRMRRDDEVAPSSKSVGGKASPAPEPSAVKPPAPVSKAPTRRVVVADGSGTPRETRAGVEYKVAYDLEIWKQQQVSKFMEDLREKELERMKILEDEWRRRETRRARDAEDAAQRARTMENKLKDAANALEARERKLVELEETMEYRKNKLERDAARALEESRDVVRRNNESSEHRVEIEKQKAREASRERDALQRRLELSEARVMEIEGAFAAHKKAQLETSESVLQAELSRLVPRCEAAEAHALEESQSKERYKGQLTKMARQVVALERERTHLRRALERAGINISSRAHVAPSANEFMNEMLAGDGADADAFMASFRADVDAVAAGGGFGRTFATTAINNPPSHALPAAKTVFVARDQGFEGFEGRIDAGHDLENFAPTHHASKSVSIAEKAQAARAAEKQVGKLVKERGDLMRTGMYSSGDKIIALIDAQIEALTDRVASAY